MFHHAYLMLALLLSSDSFYLPRWAAQKNFLSSRGQSQAKDSCAKCIFKSEKPIFFQKEKVFKVSCRRTPKILYFNKTTPISHVTPFAHPLSKIFTYLKKIFFHMNTWDWEMPINIWTMKYRSGSIHNWHQCSAHENQWDYQHLWFKALKVIAVLMHCPNHNH